jgi:hypothetical protein
MEVELAAVARDEPVIQALMPGTLNEYKRMAYLILVPHEGSVMVDECSIADC